MPRRHRWESEYISNEELAKIELAINDAIDAAMALADPEDEEALAAIEARLDARVAEIKRDGGAESTEPLADDEEPDLP